MRHFPFILYVLSSIFIIISICRPQSESKWIEKNSEGIDIVLCIDVSSSMGERDLKPNRLEAAKSVVHDFLLKKDQTIVLGLLFLLQIVTENVL